MLNQYQIIRLITLIATFGTFATCNIIKCCDDGEILKKGGKCADGKKSKVTCESAAIIDSTVDNYTIDANGNLIISDDIFETDDYCMAKLSTNSTEVAIVCVKQPFAEGAFTYTTRAICALISSICLFLTILVYTLVDTLRDLQGKCILNSIIGLAFGFTFLCAIQFELVPETLCVTAAFVVYFSFMVAFLWLNILSFHKWKTVVNPRFLRNMKDFYLKYCIYGFGMPIVLLIIIVIAHNLSGSHVKPGFSDLMCWFETREAHWAYFYGPLSLLLLANVFFFAWTAKVLWTDFNDNNPKCKSLKYKFFLYLKLFFIMGLTWIFEVLSFAFENNNTILDYIWIVVDYINALQGVLIFLILVLLRKKALKGLAEKKFCCIRFPKKWTTLKDDECDENQDLVTSLSQDNANIT